MCAPPPSASCHCRIGSGAHSKAPCIAAATCCSSKRKSPPRIHRRNMVLDINAVQFLIAARKSGVEFGDVVTLGRQDLNVYPATLKALFESHGFSGEAFAPGAPDTGFAEPVFKALGAKNVYALDFSDFEGAQFVHDLNKPLPENLKQRFDIVYDGGTLEHVFHFPQAL